MVEGAERLCGAGAEKKLVGVRKGRLGRIMHTVFSFLITHAVLKKGPNMIRATAEPEA